MAGAGSNLGKPKKAAGKSVPPASSQAKAGQAPAEVGPSKGKGKAESAAKAEPKNTTAVAKETPAALLSHKTQAKPAAAAEAKPPAVEAMPAAEAKPLAVEAKPLAAEAKPLAAEAKPLAAEAKPAGEAVPFKAISSKNELDKLVKEAGERLVVIFFSGIWCETCQTLKPYLREMAQLNTLVMFYEVNVDESEDTAEACDVIHIPTFQFFKLGQKVAEVLDDNKDSVAEKIKELK
uniref:thioredoxin domain-containing protein 2-like n=1 Tax=Pristiophorus japonicus TaxID=55135 RepID=UPI00398F6AF6